MTAPLFTTGTVNFPAGVPTPSYSSQVTFKPKVVTASFGDGYSQRTVDGLNHNRQIWNNVWDNLLDSEMTNLRNFLDTMAGVGAFLWAPPRDPASGIYKFICQDWAFTPTDAGAGRMTATFTQVFDLG